MLRRIVVTSGVTVLFLVGLLTAIAASATSNVTVSLGYTGNGFYNLVATGAYSATVIQTDLTGTQTSPIFFQQPITRWVTVGNQSVLTLTTHAPGWQVVGIQVKDQVRGSKHESLIGWMLLYLSGEPTFLKRDHEPQTPVPTATPILATPTPTPPGPLYLPLLQR